ncbi:TetR/AcrR family transcriptional regulator [Streptomyces sp. NPDC088725]|uniref:TetR/AcrR family transcriptional regulator n=1 Tax=Streptomyces sp. NPDC088725 TaxID=3365873 RepID=UPI003815AF2D
MASEAARAKRPPRTSVWLEGKPPGRSRKPDPTGRPDATGDISGASGDSGVSGASGESCDADHPSGLDRLRITAVSVRLLDAEGLAKFSMRRLAGELGVTAMSLYWYVDTKDDLLEMALDSVFGEIRVPDLTDENADWRDQLRELAVSYRTVLVRHAWISPLIGQYLNIGPRSMHFSSAVQAVMRRTGLAPSHQKGAFSAVFQFVYGFGTIEGHYVQRCAEAEVSQDEYYRHAMGSISEKPEFQGSFHQETGESAEAGGGDTVEEMRERDFTFALELLIAGIEAMRARE